MFNLPAHSKPAVPARRRLVLVLLAACLLLGVGAQSALADAPAAASTGGFTIDNATSATISGQVSTGGLSTNYWFEYAPSSDAFCTGGTGGSPVTVGSGTASGSLSSVSPTFDLSGLTADTSYCYAMFAENADNNGVPAAGSLASFVSGAPSSNTYDVQVDGPTSAAVTGEVDPGGQTDATVAVAYAPGNSMWCSDPAHNPPPPSTVYADAEAYGSSTQPNTDWTMELTGMTQGTSYCAALAVKNGAVPNWVVDGAPITITAGAPGVTTDLLWATSATTAEINGVVNPSGQTGVTYVAEYAPLTSTWCTTNGSSGSAQSTSPAQTLPYNDTANHSVSVSITGLTASTSSSSSDYCARIIASNADGVADVQTYDYLPDFTAGVPLADTSDANPSSSTSATVDGDVDPSGQATSYYVAYDTAGSTWCSSNGSSGSPTYATTPTLLSGTPDASSHTVTATVSNLQGGTDYCAELFATNGSGSSQQAISDPITPQPTNSQVTFTTPVSPAVVTSTATSVGGTTATINGTVNPEGDPTTTYWAAYDVSGSNFCNGTATSDATTQTTSPQSLGAGDSTAHSVAVALSSLTTNTQYCAAIVAGNGGGTSYGTPAVTFQPTAPPVVSAGTGTATGASTETLSGSVNPNGQLTSYQFKYALASHAWCTSGHPGSPDGVAPASPASAGSGTIAVAETGSVSGLTPGSAYCWELVATNASGTTSGDGTSFTAGLPGATTDAATAVTTAGATLNGAVDPEGSATQYSFEYARSTSTWCTTAGASGSPTVVGPTPLGQTDTSEHAVSTAPSGLVPGAAYCFAVSATNAAGTATGSQLTVTVPAAPAVSTSSVSGVGQTGATVAGTVNPESDSTTTYWVAYDVSGSALCNGSATSDASTHTTSVENLGAGDDTAHSVSVALTGLTASTAYCAEFVAENATGTAYGTPAVAFTTSAPSTSTGPGSGGNPPPPPPPTPPKCSLAKTTGHVLLKKPKKSKSKAKIGTLVFTAKCAGAVKATFTGTVTETIKVKKGKKTKKVTKTFKVSTVHVSLSAGKATPIDVKLPGAVLTGLKKRAKVSGKFTLTGGAAPATVSLTVTG